MAQYLKTCVIIAFLSAVFVGVAFGYVAEQNYWNTMLPSTRMPQALLDALANSEKADGMYKTSSKNEIIWLSDKSLYILKKDLCPGTNLHNVQFKNYVKRPPFASPDISARMPRLVPDNLQQLFEFFSIHPNSKAAKFMNQTIQKCDQPDPSNDGVQLCAASLQTMITFVTSKLGDSQKIKVVSMSSLQSEKIRLVDKIPPKTKAVSMPSLETEKYRIIDTFSAKAVSTPSLETENIRLVDKIPAKAISTPSLKTENIRLVDKIPAKAVSTPSLETEEIRLVDKIPSLETENIRLVDKIPAKAVSTPSLETENIRLVDKIPSLETENIRLVDKIPSLETENIRLVDKIPSLETENIRLVDKIPSLETENIRLADKIIPAKVDSTPSLETEKIRFIDTFSAKAVSMSSLRTPADYKIRFVDKIAPQKSTIACHSMGFPVKLYYCHQPRDAEAYAVSIVGAQDGAKRACCICYVLPAASINMAPQACLQDPRCYAG